MLIWPAVALAQSDSVGLAPIPESARRVIHEAVTAMGGNGDARRSQEKIGASLPGDKIRIASWGGNTLNPAGVTGATSARLETPVWSDIPFKALAGGFGLVYYKPPCLLRSDGAVYCWFKKSEGEATEIQKLPMPTMRSLDISGQGSNCGWSVDGEAWCRKNLFDAQKYIPKWLATEPDNPDFRVLFASFKTMQIGLYDSCAMTAAGKVWCWGEHYGGALNSRQEKTIPDYPIQINLPGSAQSIWGEKSGPCAVLTDDSVSCWAPGPVPKVAAFMPGEKFKQFEKECGLRKSDGSVWCQEVSFDNTRRGNPSQVMNDSNQPLTQITAIRGSCGTDTQGFAWCWHGMRGNPSAKGTKTASRVLAPGTNAPLQNVLAVALGQSHAAIVGAGAAQPVEDPSMVFMAAASSGNYEKALAVRAANAHLVVTGPLAEKALVQVLRDSRLDVLEVILGAPYQGPIGDGLATFFRYVEYDPQKPIDPALFVALLQHNILPGSVLTETRWLLRKVRQEYKNVPGTTAMFQAIDNAISAPFDMPLRRKTYPSPVCPAQNASVSQLINYYPAIFLLSLAPDHAPVVKQFFKGSRQMPLALPKKIDLKSHGAPAELLVLAGSEAGVINFDGCTRIYDLKTLASQPVAAGILADVSIYYARMTKLYSAGAAQEAESYAKSLRERGPGGAEATDPEFALYSARADSMREYGDYLALRELASDALIPLTEKLAEPEVSREDPRGDAFTQNALSDMRSYADNAREHPRLCVENPGMLSLYLRRPAAEKLLAAMAEGSRAWGREQGTPAKIARYTSDLAYALLRRGDLDASLAALCYTRDPQTYIQAMKNSGRGAELANVKIGRLTPLNGVDISGVSLPGVQAASAIWKDVDARNTNLSGAAFEATNLETVLLDGAILTGASFDCRTKFPPGFDPIARGMIMKQNSSKCERR